MYSKLQFLNVIRSTDYKPKIFSNRRVCDPIREYKTVTPYGISSSSPPVTHLSTYGSTYLITYSV